MLRIAHISDLHFGTITYSPCQFFSKRWLGNCNLIFTRRKTHDANLLAPLPALFSKLKVDLVIVTGDLSTTGQEREFQKAAAYCDLFQERGIKLLFIPGNHDHYTKKDYLQKRFYQFFSNPTGDDPFTLKDNQLEIRQLKNEWWYLAIDTVIPTHLLSSQGLFSEGLEGRLADLLSRLPKDRRVIFINHFPFFPFDNPRKKLKRGMALGNLLKQYPQVIFYLHGHTHRHCIADLRPSHFPIILDSGSASMVHHASFNLLDLSPTSSTVAAYRFMNEQWEPWKTSHFAL